MGIINYKTRVLDYKIIGSASDIITASEDFAIVLWSNLGTLTL